MSDEDRREHTAALLKRRALELARAPRKTARKTDLEILQFMVMGKPLACEIGFVREVLRNTLPITPLPGLPSFFMGIVNIRGEIVPVIDIAAFLELQGSKQDSQSLVILQKGVKVVGFPCDRIERVREIARKELQTQVASQNRTLAGLSMGCGEKGLVVLNASALLDDPRLSIMQE